MTPWVVLSQHFDDVSRDMLLVCTLALVVDAPVVSVIVFVFFVVLDAVVVTGLLDFVFVFVVGNFVVDILSKRAFCVHSVTAVYKVTLLNNK